MPNESKEDIQIEFTPEFKRNLRMLAKKYHSIRLDIQPIIEQLQKGITIGDQIPEVGLLIFKARVLNRDIQKGKRSGYRLIYYKKTRIKIILVTVYSKLEQSDISSKEIKSIVQEFEES
ncbi:MAG: type II toxin-antitoxin system RelE/ParE family toxin [bacterium]